MRDERGRIHVQVQAPKVVVLIARSSLGINNAAFRFHDGRVDSQIRQPVSLQVKYRLKRGSREPILVDRQVFRGIRVVRPTGGFHGFVKFALRATLCAVEHHVFKKV